MCRARAEHAIPVKPIDGFLSRFEALMARVLARKGRTRRRAGRRRRRRRRASALGRAPVAAGGRAQPDSMPADCRSSWCPTSRISCRAFRRRFAHASTPILAARGIAVVTGTAVTGVEAGRLLLDGHAPVEADEILWTTQAAPARWLAQAGLPLDAKGFLKVDQNLRVVGHADVFAAGDTIAFATRELPKSGVYAVRAGPVLADNIRRTLIGKVLRPFRPQRQALYLVSTGERRALGSRNGLVVEGAWVWRWKDWIDRRFMRKFNELPEMTIDAGGAAAAGRSAGAQGNFGYRHALRRLRRQGRRAACSRARCGLLQPAARADVVVGLDAPDDAALVDVGGDQALASDRRLFPRHRRRPLHARQDRGQPRLGDIFAMGGEPQSALAIATVPFGLEARWKPICRADGGRERSTERGRMALVGGHTSEGAELAWGSR